MYFDLNDETRSSLIGEDLFKARQSQALKTLRHHNTAVWSQSTLFA